MIGVARPLADAARRPRRRRGPAAPGRGGRGPGARVAASTQRLLAGRRLDEAIAVPRAASRAGSAGPAARPRPRGPAARASGAAFSRARRPPPSVGGRAHLAEGQREAEGARRAGCGSRPRSGRRAPATIARQIGRPRPKPPLPGAPRGRTSRRRGPPSPGGRPGPVVRDLDRRPRAPCRRRRRRRAIGEPGGVYLNALSSRLTRTCSISTASTGTSGRSARDRRPRPRRPLRLRSSAGQRRAHQLLERVPVACEAERRRTPAASCRAGSSPAGRAGPPRRRSPPSARARGAAPSARAASSALAAPVMAASGVRRSWETELRSVLRSRSVSTSSRPAAPRVARARAARLAGQRLERGRAGPASGEAATRRDARPSTPSGGSAALQREVDARRPGQGVGAEARGCADGRAPTARPRSRAGSTVRSVLRRASRPSGPGSRTSAGPWRISETWRAAARVTSSTVLARRDVAAHRVQDLRPLLPPAGGLGLRPRPAPPAC